MRIRKPHSHTAAYVCRRAHVSCMQHCMQHAGTQVYRSAPSMYALRSFMHVCTSKLSMRTPVHVSMCMCACTRMCVHACGYRHASTAASQQIAPDHTQRRHVITDRRMRAIMKPLRRKGRLTWRARESPGPDRGIHMARLSGAWIWFIFPCAARRAARPPWPPAAPRGPPGLSPLASRPDRGGGAGRGRRELSERAGRRDRARAKTRWRTWPPSNAEPRTREGTRRCGTPSNLVPTWYASAETTDPYLSLGLRCITGLLSVLRHACQVHPYCHVKLCRMCRGCVVD